MERRRGEGGKERGKKERGEGKGVLRIVFKKCASPLREWDPRNRPVGLVPASLRKHQTVYLTQWIDLKLHTQACRHTHTHTQAGRGL